jgi:hypothetical protein
MNGEVAGSIVEVVLREVVLRNGRLLQSSDGTAP